MLWRHRRRRLPPAVDPAGHGRRTSRATATRRSTPAVALGGPALAIKTIKQFTGLQINHLIIVNLGAFPPFIDASAASTSRPARVCANISGGTANGGFTLDLSPGVHHLNGLQALIYSRIRENPCNPADSDLTREIHQQQILNAIRSQLVSPSTRSSALPWASWAAPKVLQTDMGGLTLMSLFARLGDGRLGSAQAARRRRETLSDRRSGMSSDDARRR